MRYLLPLCFLFSFLSLSAQETYSYVSDRVFKSPIDLLGYKFKPAIMEIPDSRDGQQPLPPDSYSFGVTQNNLYVIGEGIKGVYNVNNINTTEYGFILSFINARDARIQGHLKIILNKYRQADALVFRRTTSEKEIIFFQELMPEELRSTEETYFSDLGEVYVENPDSLHGITLHPFLILHQDKNIQQRLQIRDSCHVNFYKVVRVVEKEKKKKLKDKDKNKELETNKPVLDSMVIENGDTLWVEKKIKTFTEYYLDVRQILKYEDGTQEDKKTTYQIKGISERKDRNESNLKEHYQIEIKNNKGVILFLYLDANRNVSSLEVNTKKYFLRGI